MAQKDAMIAELKHEALNTRRMLEVVPTEKFSWQPHEKSMTIGRLASHMAELPVWVNRTLDANEFDLANPLPRNSYEGRAELIKVFEEKQAAALVALQDASDEQLDANYILRRADQILYEMPRKVFIRNFALNHLVHHRGQLSVFLRLLDIPVPGMYGPSADDLLRQKGV